MARAGRLSPVKTVAALLALAVCLPPRSAQAYAIVATRAVEAPTIAEIFVEEGLIRVEVETSERPPEVWREFVFRAGRGEALSGRVVKTQKRAKLRRDEISGEPLPATEGEAEPVVLAVVEYRFRGRPETLAITAPKMGFIVYHLGLPVTDLHYIDGEEVLELDWQDPWNSRFRNRKLRRQYDAPVSVFLYVEPYEVRAEIVVRPVDLEHWVDLGIGQRKTIPAVMQEELKGKVAAFLAGHSNLTIDGEPAQPVVDRVHFLRRRLWSSAVIDPPEDLRAVSATLGVIFVVPTDGLPREVALEWDLFSPGIQQVAASATDEAGPRPSMLRPDSNVLRWENFLTDAAVPTMVKLIRPPGPFVRFLPFVGGLCGLAGLVVAIQVIRRLRRRQAPTRTTLVAGFVLLLATAVSFASARSSKVSDREAGRIVGNLLYNVYRSFDFRDENTVYDMLARSVSGELLAETYLETRRALEIKNQGGARARVKEVEVAGASRTNLSGGAGFVSTCTWNVTGSVAHWGHIHQRRNQYEAVLRVEPVDGAWKITGMELLSEQRQ